MIVGRIALFMVVAVVAILLGVTVHPLLFLLLLLGLAAFVI